MSSEVASHLASECPDDGLLVDAKSNPVVNSQVDADKIDEVRLITPSPVECVPFSPRTGPPPSSPDASPIHSDSESIVERDPYVEVPYVEAFSSSDGEHVKPPEPSSDSDFDFDDVFEFLSSPP